MIKKLIQRSFVCIVIIVSGFTKGFSQTDTAKINSYEGLSLKDLLNVRINTVSKTSELLFDAPLSASVITREEIRRTGCTSIMEALRLVPGMIVREQSNGNYDIHLRGMDNVPPNAPFDITSNTTTLVMIDARPVYSYLRGGTFWETLPIDINDVERIEVIRGPAAALYGPNAVNGVINIITRQPITSGLYLVANSHEGSLNTFINNLSVGYKSENWNIIASGNYQDRNRSQTSYFEFTRNEWLDNPDYFISFNQDTITNVKQLYPDPRLAMEKYAGNLFVSYDDAKKVKLNFSTGIQHSTVQKVSVENEITPLSTALSDSRYIDFRANVQNLSAQFSYNAGTQVAEYSIGNKYDFNIFDAGIEYNYTKGNFSLKPGLSYKRATYDDLQYSDFAHRRGIFNARGIIITKSASLRGEYKLIDNKLRLVAAISTNTFNYPDFTYIAYQFAATYKVNKNHLFRAVYSQAPRSSNVFDTYVDQALAYYPVGYKNYNELAIVGNKSLKLLTANMLEFGYRGRLTSALNIDVELFNIDAKNYSIPVQSHPIIEFDGTDTVHETPIRLTNLPLKLVQRGVTVSITYNSKKLQVNPFITLQQTKAKNYSPSIVAPDAGIAGAAENNIYSGTGSEMQLKSTPTAFGGAQINYVFTSKINLNVSAYYYSSQTYQHVSNLIFNDDVRGIDYIQAKLIVNANISYEAVKNLHLFLTGKNILNNGSREFFKADDVPFMLFGGINYELK